MIQIILGPPGTGKTTTLLDLIDESLKKGVHPEKIGFISFTKKSVNEAVDRASKRFGIPQSDFLYFRTIHSLAFRQLTLSKNNVMQPRHYREIGELMGTKILGYQSADCQVYEMNKGDQMVFVESLSRLKCEDLEDTYNDIGPDVSFYELKHFQRTLAKYKQVNMLLDFTDMLQRFFLEGYKPPLDVLFVDEAQDLCRLQWNIVSELCKTSKTVYIAGDDDQAIFRWAGADVDYFLELSKKHPVKVLKKSYRIPKEVFDYSIKFTKEISQRAEKIFEPKEDKGKVEYINNLDDINMGSGSWLLLVRNTYMINSIAGTLRFQGLPYQTAKYSISSDDAIQAAFIWERLRKGETLKGEKINKLKPFMSNKNWIGKIKFGAAEDVDMAHLKAVGTITENVSSLIWHEALDLIPAEDREYFIALRKKGESIINEPRIKVSTIHGAKGGEAGNVVLFMDISMKTYRSMLKNYDDELRVFYVGATRAKENLYIMQPQTNNYFSI